MRDWILNCITATLLDSRTQDGYLIDLLRERIPRVISTIPAIIAPQIPRRERVVTMMAAMKTPKRIDTIAFWSCMLKRNAATEPVHAPVTGSGMATKSIRPMDL